MPGYDSPIDHVGLLCPEDLLEEEMKFINAALGPLGMKEQFRIMPLVVAIGDTPHNTFFWISALDKDRQPLKGPVSPVHFALKAKSRTEVDEFHKAGLAAGGKDNGAPGIREMYHAGYYAAFLIDPCGNNIEVVIHESPAETKA